MSFSAESVDELTTRSLEQAVLFSDARSQSPVLFWTAFCDEVSSSTLSAERQRDVLKTAVQWIVEPRLQVLESWAGASVDMQRMLMVTVESVSDAEIVAIAAKRVKIEDRRRRARSER